MKKILFAFVLAAMSLGMFGFASADVTPTPAPTPGLVCMQNAIAKRDGSIITAFGKFSTAITTALNARKNDLIAAWGVNNTKERRRAIKASWNAFGKSNKDARVVLRNERNSAWNQFKVDAKVCRITNIGAEGEKMGNKNL
ncbi:MAG: hypothetical protein A2736_01200 [Candidatus Yanofskybacteria bacterium RIFCSPHIGHO2_01_FULL_41_27]|uniref:Uncharacterized protein n=5 Tax=Parcubacteria group TaxID=1794811 RepID=A0A1F8HQ82_9BACT|nr:MAG: hypothetical protein UU84_C0017G0004 [Candidatus Yanofskybacteria bacterium GW2011_GWC2_41_9]KKT61945.1 MAG: hypothetical protein UW55_C0020G0009 [Candidatus Giovannonibacteria bacterium GW2011_GWA2_44_26]KKU16389.1 MAG: hypothetical protein UX24_C0011G0014 [Candidatus Giovannonibacteria bacterium GW2011_GWB1_45_9b]OGM98848.1 MAG: hypothetical protein A2736_01200 [Candidatus Yanofskybacteria bacterium RIFCSPHIGHO2_01_FULL_41_27]OGN10206.1 MAG: hypothetical protein A3C64_00740 [Candidatu